MTHSAQNPLRFPRETWLYMILRIVFSAGCVILNLFISTFLLKSYGNFSSELITYNIIMRTVQPVGVFVALVLTRKFAPKLTQAMGLLLFLISLVVLCIFGDGVSGLYPIFAVLLGFADAFFYGVNTMQMLTFTKDENRDRFNGVLGLISGIVSLFMPILSGYIIQYFPDFTGYRIMFGFAAVCIGVSLFFTMGLNVPVPKKTASIGSTLKRILGDRNCMRCIIANSLTHCKGSVLGTFLTMLVYNLISNEAVIGLRSSLSSIASLVSVALYGMFIRSANRTKGSVIAMTLVLLPCLWMLFELNVAVLMVFTVVYAFAGTFMDTPTAFTYYKAVEALNLHGDAGAAVQLAADIFVAIATNSGFLLIAVVPRTNYWAVALVVTMMLTSVVSTLLVRRADKNLNIRHKV